MHDLGLAYAMGRGVPVDGGEAVKWYRKAAELGHAKAMFNLGTMYAIGMGVPQDDTEAYVWLSVSSGFGGLMAQEPRDLIAQELTERDLLRAQQRSKLLVEQISARVAE